jgi:ribosomal protein L27
MGRDFTLYARIGGIVKYEPRGKDKKQVSVYTETPA